MALRLAGEGYSEVYGLDSYGWLREVQANDASPGVKVDQRGSGLLAQLLKAGASRHEFGDGVYTMRNADTVVFRLDHAASGNFNALAELQGLSNGVLYGFLRFRRLTDNVSEVLLNPLGGSQVLVVGDQDVRLMPASRIDAQKAIYNSTANNSGRVLVEDALEVTDHLICRNNHLLGLTAGESAPLTAMLTNKNASRAMAAGDVAALDTANARAVVDPAGTGNELRPLIVSVGGAANLDVQVVLAGKASVMCDTGAVGIGDLLVTSSATAGQAMANNGQTDPNRMIGVALTAKAGGSTGLVTCLVKTW